MISCVRVVRVVTNDLVCTCRHDFVFTFSNNDLVCTCSDDFVYVFDELCVRVVNNDSVSTCCE